MSSESLDEFAPESFRSEYSQDRIVGSIGDPDHGQVMRGPTGSLRVPSYLAVMITQIVAEIPEYASVADFFRDAAYHRAHYFRERKKLTSETDNKIREYETFAQVQSNKATRAYYQSQLQDIEQQLRDSSSIPALYRQVLADAEMLSLNWVDPYWAKQMRDLLRRHK